MPPRISGEAPWRRSRIVQGVANPAAGVDWSATVPASHLWRPFSVTAVLTTSATVANRQARLILGDGTNTFAWLTAPAVQAASLAWVYTWAVGAHAVALGLQALGYMPDVELSPGWTIGVSTLAIDATDQWSAIRLGLIDTTERWGGLDLAADRDVVYMLMPETPPG